ncbi:uncharacterized protein [Fopius arisanus]|uniref:MiaB_1 protein n=1 Tax=Fopius arisanus TaxID=64838 RepID=A0A0C9PJU0_9HYME|nr:PREDICTED: uncharacterized protein LOC105272735 [Fopius arisanus]
MEQEECTEFIILQDQATLLETLMKNVSILKHEAPQVTLIDAELEIHLVTFKEISNNLSIKLGALNKLSERLDPERKKDVLGFVEKIQESWKKTVKEITDEHLNLSVVSRSAYGHPLTSILSEIKRETSAIQVSLQIGEMIYDSDFVLQGFLYCTEIFKLLNDMEGCDKRIQQYLVTPKVTAFLQGLDTTVEAFSKSNDLLPPKEQQLEVFSKVSSLLTEELLGWKPDDPDAILKDSNPKRPVFITKNTKRTQVKRLANLPLFNSVHKEKSTN